jgi:hypothetical protein
MIPFLVFCSLLIPVNLWAAITPHMHSDVSMRILHGVCTVVLIPLLWTLWAQRRLLRSLPALVLAIFAMVMVVVNSWITAMGMGVQFGWLDHLFLALSEVALTLLFLMAPEPEPITGP